MRIEVMIDRSKKLPNGAIPALEQELKRRLDSRYDATCSLTIRRAGSDGLFVFGANDDTKKDIEELLQETWESADDWFF